MKTFPSVTFFIKIQEIIFNSKVGNYQDAYSGGYPFSISGDIRSVPS